MTSESISKREEKKRLEADKRMREIRGRYLPDTQNSVPLN